MKVLVFGGTQFLGRLTVEALLNAGHEVVLLNRGRTTNPFEGKANLRWVKADRMGDRLGFKRAVAEQGECDVVIDFIGFQEAYVQDTLEALTLPGNREVGKKNFAMKHYIFISTDSVYWAQKVPVTSRLSEEMAKDFSAEEFEIHHERCKHTSLGEYQLRYGGNKLGCEQVLQEAWQTDGFPYTVLRLPDAYGPYDNLGGFWEIVMAIEGGWPIHSGMHESRARTVGSKEFSGNLKERRFSWVFAEDARDAILACLRKGSEVHGISMHVAHEEAMSLHETASMIAETMGRRPEAIRFDDKREAALPSTDFGALEVGQALRLLRPWRPTIMRTAVQRSIAWFLSSREHRRYHRMVHREMRYYDDTEARTFRCEKREVPECWVGSSDKAALVRDGPAILRVSLPDFTGQAVLGFMQRLMDQVGETQVACELQRENEKEVGYQKWPLRHFAGHLLPQSEHIAAYRLEEPQVLSKTDLISEFTSPLADLYCDSSGQPPSRILRLGGAGARSRLRRSPQVDEVGGLWDCALLGRRRWRFFPPETPLAALSASSATTPSGHQESPVDCFFCGPDANMVPMQYTNFAPTVFWECEQTMGDAIVVPNGWWYQTYDDDRTLSIAATYAGLLSESKETPKDFSQPDEEPEVIEFELVD